MMKKEMKTGTLVLCAVFCTMLWGSAFPCIKTGYQLFQIKTGDIGSQMLFAGVRFFVAGILTIVTSLFLERKTEISKELKKRTWSGILLLGFIQTFLQYVFYYIGMAHVTGVKGAILNGTSAFLCVITARIFYNETLTKNKIIGCVIGLSGVVIVNLGKGSLGKGSLGNGWSFLGEGFMLISAMMVALGALVSKEVSKGRKPIWLCGWQLVSGGFLLILLGICMGGNLSWQQAGGKGIVLLGYMSLLSAVAFGIWTVLLKKNPMGKVTVYNFLIPVFGTIFSAIFLGETLWNPYTIISLPFVCIGIYLVNYLSK